MAPVGPRPRIRRLTFPLAGRCGVIRLSGIRTAYPPFQSEHKAARADRPHPPGNRSGISRSFRPLLARYRSVDGSTQPPRRRWAPFAGFHGGLLLVVRIAILLSTVAPIEGRHLPIEAVSS